MNTRIQLRVPQKYDIHKLSLTPYGMTPCAVRGPTPTQSYASSVRGVYSWVFGHGHDLRMAVGEEVAVSFTTFQRSDAVASPIPSESLRPILDFAFWQRSPWMGARSVTTRYANNVNQQIQLNIDNGVNPVPIGGDAGAYGLAADSETAGLYALNFPGTQFDRSNVSIDRATQGVPSAITGFGVMVDQIALDDAGAGVEVFMPLHNLAGMAVFPTVDSAGRGRPWWQDFAPISLVTPSMNETAIVYPLVCPIRLMPERAIDIIVETGTGVEVDTFDPLWNVGVSTLGFAEINEAA
jgi:hypothetical protein